VFCAGRIKRKALKRGRYSAFAIVRLTPTRGISDPRAEQSIVGDQVRTARSA
jgi:hypothetical protein